MNVALLFGKINQKHLFSRKNNKLYLKHKGYYILIEQSEIYYMHMVEKIPEGPHTIIYKDGDYYTMRKNDRKESEKLSVIIEEIHRED